MCINPSYVWIERGPKWEKQPVACKQCWSCKRNRIDDYVGRCLCEAATSSHVCAITLTYAPRDDLADKVLHPRHFQLFIKMLRRAGHSVRYLVAGEYGDLRDRAHFHALLFFSDIQRPLYSGDAGWYNPAHISDPLASRPFSDQLPQKRMAHIREWPHGHVQVDWSSDERAIRYVCKYLLADDKNRAWFSLSKKPVLGAAWFAQKAKQARDLGVLPSSFVYLPPGGDRNKEYLLTGASRRDYLNAITSDPADKPRMSEWCRNTFDKHERQRVYEAAIAQPSEVLHEAWLENRAREDEQVAYRQYGDALRDGDYLDGLLKQSENGILRRDERGRWQPEKRKDNDNGSSS